MKIEFLSSDGIHEREIRGAPLKRRRRSVSFFNRRGVACILHRPWMENILDKKMQTVELIQTNIGSFYIDTRDKFVGKELAETGDYSPAERGVYQNFISPESNVLWLGAHIGAHVVPLSKQVRSITAFEANPETYEIFAQNLEINGCSNVNSFNLAANDVEGELEFVCNSENSGGSKRMPKEMNDMYLDKDTKFVNVQAVGLDDFLDNHKFDFVFMDIEGSETAALKGMPKILSHAKVVVSEFIPHHLKLVAGVTLSEFLDPLNAFQTLIVPSLRSHVHGPEIYFFLQRMLSSNRGDPGLIFHKDVINVNWG